MASTRVRRGDLLVEQYRFTRGRQVGKHAWIVSREIDPA